MIYLRFRQSNISSVIDKYMSPFKLFATPFQQYITAERYITTIYYNLIKVASNV